MAKKTAKKTTPKTNNVKKTSKKSPRKPAGLKAVKKTSVVDQLAARATQEGATVQPTENHEHDHKQFHAHDHDMKQLVKTRKKLSHFKPGANIAAPRRQHQSRG